MQISTKRRLRLVDIVQSAWARLLFLTLYCELIIRLDAGGGLLAPGVLFTLLFGAVWSLLTVLLCRCFSEKVNRILYGVFTAAVTIVYGGQYIYYQIFGTYFTVYSMLNGGGQALGFIKELLSVLARNLHILALILLPAALMFVSMRRGHLRLEPLAARKRVAALVAAAVLEIAALGLLPAFGRAMNAPFDAFFNVRAIDTSANALGVGTAMRLDFVRLVAGVSSVEGEPVDMSGVEVVEEPLPPGDDPEPLLSDGEKYGYNLTETGLKAVAANEESAVLADVASYFASVEPTAKNAMTGLFEGKNLILITAEAFSPLAIDPELTPTLYKLYSEGMQFENFYTPLWGVSTSDGEYVACTGLLPETGVWSMRRSSANELPYCLGNQFAALGYGAYAYHDHDASFYGRDLSHPNMGYDFKAVGRGLEITKLWPESDLEMIDVTTPEYLNGEPFHVYYMTVSGHLYYTFEGNQIAEKNRSYVENLDYSEHVKAYLACQIELDRALGLLLERLEAAGELEDTVIALSADHYPYGLTHDEISELAGAEIDPEFEIYRSAFLLYNAATEPVSVSKPCSSLDILPTLSNLFGLEYDSRLLMGRDIFSDSEGLVIFSDHSWLTADARYNARANELIVDEDAALPDDYAQKMTDLVEGKFKYSAKILDLDYYGALFGGEDASGAP